jgi:hypothetical protein
LVLDGGRCSGRGRSIGPGKRDWTAVSAEEDWRRSTAQDSGDDDGDWKRSTPATTGEEAPSDRVGKGRTAEATAWQERSAAAPCPNPIRALAVACRLCLHLADRFRSDTDTLDHLPLNETTGYAEIRECNFYSVADHYLANGVLTRRDRAIRIGRLGAFLPLTAHCRAGPWIKRRFKLWESGGWREKIHSPRRVRPVPPLSLPSKSSLPAAIPSQIGGRGGAVEVPLSRAGISPLL